jgi:hypothetical protein
MKRIHEFGAFEAKNRSLQRIRARAEQSKLGHLDWSEWKTFRDDGRP